MRDVLYVLITMAFFAVAVALVKGCDLLIGPDEEELPEGAEPAPVATTGAPR